MLCKKSQEEVFDVVNCVILQRAWRLQHQNRVFDANFQVLQGSNAWQVMQKIPTAKGRRERSPILSENGSVDCASVNFTMQQA